jgi:lipoprotein-releasing system permease protein
LNFERFTAWKMITARQSDTGAQIGNIRTIIRIAIAGIAISMIVMLLSVSIVQGFQREIRKKVIGFGGHIQITNIQTSDSYEGFPIKIDQPFYPEVDTLESVDNIQVFAQKAGIVKTKSEIHGVVFKGVSEDYNWRFFEEGLEEGQIPRFSYSRSTDSVLISREIANKLNLEIGDGITVYFVKNDKPRPRKFVLSGIYQTGLEGFDDLFVFGDITYVQKLNDWNDDEVGGFEINLNNYDDLFATNDIIFESLPFELRSTTIVSRHSDIFGWLELQDVNVYIIIGLMILVASINMSSALLILILNRMRMIGILKALGAVNWSIRKVFVYLAGYLIIMGLFWGNLIGLSVALVQKYLKVIKLPQETYYIPHVPIEFQFTDIFALNSFTLLLCIIVLFIPSYIITRIKPTESIQFN